MTDDDRSARDYLDHALDLLEQHAFDRTALDWPAVRADALARLDGASGPRDTYRVIDRVIARLGNPHTVLVPPEIAAEAFGGTGADEPMPSGQLVEKRFGYLNIPEARASDEADERYVRTGMALVRELDEQRPAGWIVDLRANTGGNMYPMLTVLAPLLGDGTLGAFVDAEGRQTEWRLHGGVVSVEDTAQSPVAHEYRLAEPGAPIAVLIGEQTCSAGEATLIAFLGLPNVRTFGSPTAGLATGNAAFELPDGALLAVTTAVEADRTGRVYGNDPIEPDEPVDEGAALSASVAWLKATTER
ncbi:S41 family peptidase [Amycolatopsis anabasis]|uniref:S41 family peptidase n=1 Tax=Amycolatopsis anabasis TaxID=1840409 RepID=UPI00131AB9E2|nr:S41 family peptidase [Amycolatopsis anabasis]